MQLWRRSLALCLPIALSALLVCATSEGSGSQLVSDALLARDGHTHHHHGAPLLELNETEVTMYHQPTPPSYWSIDIEDRTADVARYPGLMGFHIVMMSLAFFVALPAGIAMRSTKNAWHGVSVIFFYTFISLGCAASALYRKLTPNMYEGSVHAKQSYFVIFLACCISAVDAVNILRRLIAFIKAIRAGEDTFTFKHFWNSVMLGRESGTIGTDSEYTGLVVNEPESYDPKDFESPTLDGPHGTTASWANDVSHHQRSRSTSSEHTVLGSHEDLYLDKAPISEPKRQSLIWKIGHVTFQTAERILVFAGYAMFITGVVIYTGGCRQNYINGCLAHLIKGSIFWCYGLVTFARYLGTFADIGWAWNQPPSGKRYVTAEFTESIVIFIYGITNTWMERWGANPGDPYTAKQIEHIGIAVMFWYAGLIGMLLESKRVRRILSSTAISALNVSRVHRSELVEPPSYSASFNPFPALVIGITGAAMAAHAQPYVFEVQIHTLWGGLLLGFSVCRFLTYFYLWVAPPKSILPSRPPTEALTSFFLACGGLCFMFSIEELSIAAMRKNRDDVMMFLCVAVSMTCFAFTWVFSVVSFKGWLNSRLLAPSKLRYFSA